MRPELIDAAADRAAYQLAEVADSYIAGLYSGASTSAPDNTIETSQFTSDKRLSEVRRPLGLDGSGEPSAGRR